ncbi:MAG: hypothetical protein SGCHY_001014 [Lobulomycetales sp.]
MDSQEKLRKQIHFYFSDANLRRDKFIQSKLRESAFFPINALLAFNRIKAITDSASVIADALASSDILALSPDRSAFTRILPFKLPDSDAALVPDASTLVHISGLPPTLSPDATMAALQPSLTASFGENYITVLRDENLGSVHVQFTTASAAKAALDAKTMQTSIDNRTVCLYIAKPAQALRRPRVLFFSTSRTTLVEDIERVFSDAACAIDWINFSVGSGSGVLQFARTPAEVAIARVPENAYMRGFKAARDEDECRAQWKVYRDRGFTAEEIDRREKRRGAGAGKRPQGNHVGSGEKGGKRRRVEKTHHRRH